MSGVTFFPINPAKLTHDVDAKYIDMLQTQFDTRTLYFADDYDLTSSLQSFLKNAGRERSTSYNPTFSYNECFIGEFKRLATKQFITPFISGYVAVDYTKVQETQVQFIIVSRRDKRRAGMRFISRGTDSEGNPSNMAEQEQIVALTKNGMTSTYGFVQTRGSMPFEWS